jgi:hypothetical protein
MNKSRIGAALALPGYNLFTFYTKSFFFGAYIILPPTGTIKFLSVDDINASTLPFFIASVMLLEILVHWSP